MIDLGRDRGLCAHHGPGMARTWGGRPDLHLGHTISGAPKLSNQDKYLKVKVLRMNAKVSVV